MSRVSTMLGSSAEAARRSSPGARGTDDIDVIVPTVLALAPDLGRF